MDMLKIILHWIFTFNIPICHYGAWGGYKHHLEAMLLPVVHAMCTIGMSTFAVNAKGFAKTCRAWHMNVVQIKEIVLLNMQWIQPSPQ